MILAENPACNPSCRACHYKHLDYAAQLARKIKWARQCLAHFGTTLKEIIPAPAEERVGYRAKSWMRSFAKGGDLSFGMFRGAQVDGEWGKEFVSWNYCPLHIRPIQEMVGRLREVLPGDHLLGIWMGTPHLVLVSNVKDHAALSRMNWSQILVPPFSRVWFHYTSQVGKKIFGAHEIKQIFGPVAGDLHPIRAFRQVAGSLLEMGRTQAVQALLAGKPGMILDLYCGTGEIAQLIPENIGWLGIEHSKEAVIYARSLRNNQAALHAVYEGAVEQRLHDPQILEKISLPYAMYINPPRPGLGTDAQERVRELIRAKAPQSIVYLSCSASSLSRDLAMLCQEGYQVESLQPYDFFPQTEHFETLAVLKRTS